MREAPSAASVGGHLVQGVKATDGPVTAVPPPESLLTTYMERMAKADLEWSEVGFEGLSGPALFSGRSLNVPGAAVRYNATRENGEMTCLHRNWIVAVRANGAYAIPPAS